MEKRVFKFRAWHNNNKVMTKDVHLLDTFNEMICRDYYTVMQWTSLTDKHGKEIYEGDILRIKTQSGREENFVCQWGVHRRDMKSGYTVDIPSFSFVIEGFPTFPIVNNYMNGHDLEIIEVIGNIYETPGLIKESND
jgi:uncharacterized phage protein (TIGR01671 family)